MVACGPLRVTAAGPLIETATDGAATGSNELGMARRSPLRPNPNRIEQDHERADKQATGGIRGKA